MDRFRAAVREAGMPVDVVETTLKEIDRIAKMPSGSAEHTIGVNYLDYLTHLPWNRTTEDRLDLKRPAGFSMTNTTVCRRLKVVSWSTWR